MCKKCEHGHGSCGNEERAPMKPDTGHDEAHTHDKKEKASPETHEKCKGCEEYKRIEAFFRKVLKKG